MNAQAVVVRTGWMAVALLPLLASSAFAQGRSNGQAGQDRQISPTGQVKVLYPRLEKADELIGAKVVDQQGKWLGTVREIVLTPDRDAIDYVVLAYGGVWGVPEKLFAVPWSRVYLRTFETTFVLNVDRRNLEQAKGLDKNYWPVTARENWLALEPRARGRAFPGRAVRPLPEAAEREPVALQSLADMKYRRVRGLADIAVENPQGQALGRVDNFVIDVYAGTVAYAVLLTRPESPMLGRDLVAVPWSAFDVFPPSATARLSTDRQTLEALAFDAREFPNLEDTRYSRQLHEQFGATPYWETLGFVPAEQE